MSRRPIPLGFGIFLIRVSIYQGGSDSPDTSNYREPGENGPDRHRELERDSLAISAISCRSRILGVGVFLIRVCIYQGGPVAPDTSNYRTPEEKRARSTAGSGARLPGNIRYFFSPRVISYGISPIRGSIFHGGSVSPDTSNYRAPKEMGPADSGNWNATVWKYQLCVVATGH